MTQAGSPNIPVVQLQADVNVANGTGPALGDWRCEMDQDTFQGGSIFSTFPPFVTVPTWIGWGQSPLNWQAVTKVAFEFHQSYEFRIHAQNLNYFTNSVGLMIRYFNLDATTDQLAGPRGAVTNLSATYARVDWCGRADSDLSSVFLSGSVTNLSGNVGVAGRVVSLYSGDSELSGYLLASTTTDSQGKFSFNGVLAPMERRLAVVYAPPASIVSLDPAIDSTSSARVPVSINSPFSVTYLPCPNSSCTYARVNFRYRSLGPVQVAGVSPSSVPASVVVRTSPLKTTPSSSITVSGTNFYSGVRVYFRGSGCALIPPDLCSSDFHQATVTSQNIEGTYLEAMVPAALTRVATTTRSFQIVLYNPTGGGSWIYGPTISVTPPLWPQLHGFEFVNRDDGPSVEEFEACYGDSIFNFLRIREPYYGIWALVYLAWMDGCQGSCYGMAGTSRLMADNFLPRTTYDVPGGDGVHGVQYANGYLGVLPCEVSGALCPPKPYRWTGFDLFQPFRPLNLWGRITSRAGAQTSGEALGFWLGQLQRPVAFGPRRGWAVANPVDVLNRVRANPNDYTACVYTRDFGGGHCITPYGVIDGMRLDTNAALPIVAANFSLIKIYDNNWPGAERFIEVNLTDNTFRYQGGTTAGLYEGAGLFYVPASVYRSARHAPDPFFLGRYGIDFLRILAGGSSSASMTDASGGRVGWNATALTNGYEGALPYVPPALLRGGSNRFDTTMLFLPETNAPVSGGFYSAGGNVVLYGGMGWGDIAYGFNASNTGASNSVDGILIGLSQGLQAMGMRAGAPVTGFGAMVASRDPAGQSRVFVIDTGAGTLTPDLQLERDGFKSLTIRNRSSSALPFRLNLAGTDTTVATFEYSYELYNLPGKATLKLLLPENPAIRSLTHELDLGSDGTVDSTGEALANGQLRISEEAGMVALRWRQAGFGEVLESTSTLHPNDWVPVNAPVTTEGPDQVATVSPTKPAEFFRLRSSSTSCFDWSAFSIGARPNPWETNRFKFEAVSAAGAMLPQNSIASRGGHTGLDVAHTIRLHPKDDCETIHIDVFQTSGFVTFEAVGPLGAVVARQTLTGPGTGPQRVSLRGFLGRIHYVRVVSPNAQCLILNICCDRVQLQANQPNYDCGGFSNANAGQFPSPYLYDEVIISAAPGPVIIGPVAGLEGNWLKLKGQIEIKSEQANELCSNLRLLVWDLEGAVKVTAYNSNNAVVGTAGPLPASATPQDLVVSGQGIVRVVLSSNSDKAMLRDVCCDNASSP